jgi:carbon-monoxide dehydrogenase medium subunit
LNQIRVLKNKIRIGSGCKVSEIAENDHIKDVFTALNEGAQRLGSPLIRNLATIGGNIITARPAADLPPALIAYGAELVLKKISGERILKIDSFFKGPGETVLEPDEILIEIRIKKPPKHCGAAYLKLGVRETLEISLVNIAALIELDKPDGSIKSARIVLGSVAPTPFLSHSAEKILLGEKPTEALFTRAGEEAAKDSRPIDDFRASAEYRREMVKVLTKRVLETALNRVQAS